MSNEKMLNPGSPEWRSEVSRVTLSMVGGLITLTGEVMDKAVPRITGDDPSAAEKYLRLADIMSDMAVKLSSLSEWIKE